jgi:hypothetical protein
MKLLTNSLAPKWLLVLSLSFFIFISCQKGTKDFPAKQENSSSENSNSDENGHAQQTKTFSSDVVTRWLNMQLDMLRVPLAAGTGSQAADRAMVYCGIVTYESVVNGMPAYQSLYGQLNSFPEMPAKEPGKAYHWAASANAALAEMNRRLFPTTSAANKTAIDNLEINLKTSYANEVDASTLDRSIAFGKEVATRVFTWAATDGSANANPQYIPEPQFIGPGFWVQSLGAGNTLVTTPPNYPQAANPYAYQRRRMVPGVENGAVIDPPPAYSTDPSSPFYLMVKDVYDRSQTLTPEQTAMAIYHRDAPGYPGGGQFVAILSQVIDKADVMLDVAALAYAKTGIAMFDATTILFTKKYSINLVRPINYIRSVMGYSTWSGVFNTPGHPEFPSGHAMISATVAGSLTNVFGDNFEFDNHTYDYLSLPPRHYSSFAAMAQEMSNSRVFAGIHYQATCDKSLWLGGKVTQNVLSTVKFLKD